MLRLLLVDVLQHQGTFQKNQGTFHSLTTWRTRARNARIGLDSLYKKLKLISQMQNPTKAGFLFRRRCGSHQNEIKLQSRFSVQVCVIFIIEKPQCWRPCIVKMHLKSFISICDLTQRWASCRRIKGDEIWPFRTRGYEDTDHAPSLRGSQCKESCNYIKIEIK